MPIDQVSNIYGLNTANDVVVTSTGQLVFGGQGTNSYATVSYAYLNSTMPERAFIKTTSGQSTITALAVDDQDNIYAVGYYTTISNSEDIVVFQVNSTQLSSSWITTYGTPQTDYGYGITYLNRKVYITGSTGGMLKGQSNTGGLDYFVSAVDALTGNVDWTVVRGTVGSDQGNNIINDGSNKLYVTGIYGTNSFVECLSTTNGVQQWVQNSLTGSFSGSVLYQQKLYVSGAFKGTIDGVSTAGTSQDLFITRFNPATGTRDSWSVVAGSSSYDEIGQDLLIMGGRIYVVGYYSSNGLQPIFYHVALDGTGGTFESSSIQAPFYGIAQQGGKIFAVGTGSSSGVVGTFVPQVSGSMTSTIVRQTSTVAQTAMPTVSQTGSMASVTTKIGTFTQITNNPSSTSVGNPAISGVITTSTIKPSNTRVPVFPNDATTMTPFAGLFIWLFILARYLM